MQLVDVDPVRGKTAQAVFHRAHDPTARAAAHVLVLTHAVDELCREDNLVATALDGRTNVRLGYSTTVEVCGVDEVDSRVERAVDGPAALFGVVISPLRKHHRPEGVLAHRDASCAQHSSLHVRPPVRFPNGSG